MLRPEPNLTVALTDTQLKVVLASKELVSPPSLVENRTLKALPSRAAPRLDSMLPNVKPSSMDALRPTFALLTTEKVEPHTLWPRKDRLLPRLAPSSTEKLPVHVPQDCAEKELPSLTKLPALSDELIVIMSNKLTRPPSRESAATDRLEPPLATARKDKEDPKVTAESTDKLPATFTPKAADSVDPSRLYHRSDKELPQTERSNNDAPPDNRLRLCTLSPDPSLVIPRNESELPMIASLRRLNPPQRADRSKMDSELPRRQ